MKSIQSDKIYGYIYVTTNQINGKVYVGQHINSFFSHSYIGSGVIFKNAVKKYGQKNFTTELLENIFTNQKDLNDREQYWIKKYDSTNLDIGYNLDLGGTSLGKHSEETKKKISLSEMGKIQSEDTKIKMKKVWQNRPDGYGKKIAENFGSGRLNTKHTEETKKKMSESHKGKYISKEIRQKMTQARKEKYTDWGSYLKSKNISWNEEAKKQFSIVCKAKRWYTDGTICIFVQEGTEPTGFVSGRIINKKKGIN